MSKLLKVAGSRKALYTLLQKRAADLNTFNDDVADSMAGEPVKDVMSSTTVAAPKPTSGPMSTTIANPVGANSLASVEHNKLVRSGQGHRSPFTVGSPQ